MAQRPSLTVRLGIDVPILLAPMAGPGTVDLAIGVAQGGGLGALPCAMARPDEVRRDVAVFRERVSAPLNLNFFCHAPAPADGEREARWLARLKPYYEELGLDPASRAAPAARRPFNDESCALVEELRPEVVSFHFGLPAARLLERVRATGALVLSSATTVAEAVWLEAHGCDAVIAQGLEAGGHRGMFLSDDLAGQAGTIALVPRVVDAVRVPVIAAGGLGDRRGVAAAFALGASAVQVGTAFLHCPEARLTPAHRAALSDPAASSAITNVFTGRPARGIANRVVREAGPMSPDAPPFPRAADALGPLRAAAEATGSGDFTPMWAGQAAPLGTAVPARDLVRRLIEDVRPRPVAVPPPIGTRD
jgi:nitronate monooxygenase